MYVQCREKVKIQSLQMRKVPFCCCPPTCLAFPDTQGALWCPRPRQSCPDAKGPTFLWLRFGTKDWWRLIQFRRKNNVARFRLRLVTVGFKQDENSGFLGESPSLEPQTSSHFLAWCCLSLMPKGNFCIWMRRQEWISDELRTRMSWRVKISYFFLGPPFSFS